jgi:hypothetical protein
MGLGAVNLFNELVRPALVLGPRPQAATGQACPKCRWAGKESGSGWTKYVWVSPGDATRHNVRDEGGKPVGECLMVSCGRCNYRWREDVATPEPEAKPS